MGKKDLSVPATKDGEKNEWEMMVVVGRKSRAQSQGAPTELIKVNVPFYL